MLSSVAGVRVRRANYIYGASKAGLDAFAGGDGRVPGGLGRVAHDRPPRLGGDQDDRGPLPRSFATTTDAVAADVVAGMARAPTRRVVTGGAALRVRRHAARAPGAVASAPGLSRTQLRLTNPVGR